MRDAEWFLDHASDQGCRHQYALTHAGGAGFECLECGHVASDHEIDVALNSRAELLERGRRLAQWAQEAELLIRNIALRGGPIGDVIEARKLVAKPGKEEAQDEAG